MRPFEGINVLDCTHILAGPFATYQLATLGADVIKIEDPNEPDQGRELGADAGLNAQRMGTGFLTQGSNKRSIAIDLKTPQGQEIVRRLVSDWAHVFVENYRPGAFRALGLGYEDLAPLRPGLVYASMSAFGQQGPRASQTAYDVAIQASSGIAACTGLPGSTGLKVGAPIVDYATGTTAAFAIASALYQALRTGRGQHVDVSMFDSALMLQAMHVTDHYRNGHEARPMGNRARFTETSMHPAAEGQVQLAVSNTRQHRRFYEAIGRPDLSEAWHADRRGDDQERKDEAVREAMSRHGAAEWEQRLQAAHVPAARLRPLGEALADPQLQHRRLTHQHAQAPGLDRPLTVPVAAFTFEHDGPSVERPPARLGEHTDEVLTLAGYDPGAIADLRAQGVVR